ncbi:hypothetical protein MBLNU13_g02372t1 [Cladosporium sp. NU13]
MASEVSSMPNGNYAPQQHGFDQQQANNAYASQNYNQAPAASNPPAPAANTQSEIPKDEVGWYFVEQYYTTLSRTPEKLYLYYNKRSQFVSGNETDKVQVCVGQRAINDRIKELEFQDCKVRITNVDSQASDINIVIQVIGEISNKSQPHRKFTQTFVLATQTNGYFVLNDIFRYMIEEEEEEVAVAEPTKAEEVEEVQQESAAEAGGVQEPAPTAEETEPKTLPSSEDKATVEQAAQVVDKELQEKVVEKEQAKEEPKVEESAPAVNGAEETKEEAATEQPAAEEAPAAVEQEKPRDPEPTPVTEEPPKAAKPAAPAPVKPAVPKTWASLAASANKSVAMPAAPSAAPAAAPAQAAKPAAKSAPTATPAQSSATASSASAAQREASPAAATSGDEWTAVSGSHNRQQSRQVNGQQQQQQEPSHPRGYIKNVQENIKGPEMKEKLAQFGEINYFDIYRAKSCAFVDFKTPEGYKNALAASPFQIGDEKFWIEERRTNRPGTQQQQQFNGQRGNFQQGQRGGRGNFRGDGGRGGFGQRGGRGGAGGAARGRGGAGAPAA